MVLFQSAQRQRQVQELKTERPGIVLLEDNQLQLVQKVRRCRIIL
ncbi:hypothetical protein P298_04035 [Salmonella enterica subsp. arizonae serovar 18:z4,z23:- str. CVM N26626]|uniref:Uncharacterized protein n=1 Tax=Salmonella enterica subsp. arizonae serovar 18:z4,z23:- str. CVM N26626 TaxID=1395119 RepID=A0A3S5YDV5_SALER|nr:hypothetical protein P298_04035 [Salmonella enterica subsp. arizonae serovar 18:z4,z23:- str. CVM N26626]OLV97031.1 hypothetical protein P297_17625 [Salmonella enterica subsp. arizonae serovar 18:z4,z23:- str. CVM N26625]OLW06652.1 hypothetical protein P292_08295 [Salmonella enterica subsp. arizonae serovar 18:z4,z23:- str. CVM N18554]OLW20049.1 hypothetical protein P291_18355 [Salmonella enterica subsp. arizonae serovar 18:z4,z23:- str. CVM N18503]OLW33163.1 hypothetical protein P287_20970 